MVTFVQFVFTHKKIRYRFVLKRALIYVANSVVMAIPVLLCIFFIKIDWVILVAGIISGALTYLIMLIIERNQFVLSVFNSMKVRLKK